MKFAVLAALFAAVQAADIALPFSMDELAVMLAKAGKERFDLYNTKLVEKWTAEDVKNSVTRSATYYTDYVKTSDAWAAAIVKAAGVTGQKLTDLWNELWEQRLKLDVQFRESEKLTKSIADDLVKENPKLKEKLATDADLKSFTDAVATMGTKLVEATQAAAEQSTLDKAEAGIFDLDEAAQKEFDATQLQLKQAAEKKAQDQAEEALKALKAEVEAEGYVASTLTVAEKIAAMEKANDERVANEAKAAAAAKAQMAELQKAGLFEAGKLDDTAKKALIKAQEDAAAAASAAANPIKGKKGFPCGRFEDGKDEDGEVKYSRPACAIADGFCCGTAWSPEVDEDDTIVDGKSIHDSEDKEKQRLEVCGLAKKADPDGGDEKVDNDVYEHTMIKSNVPTPVTLKFACIVGANKALAASAAAVLAAYMAM